MSTADTSVVSLPPLPHHAASGSGEARHEDAEEDEGTFDLLIGPRTDRRVLSRVLSDCLSDKGFCVLRLAHDAEERQLSLEALRQADALGRLGRLAAEVEEGYLGRGGRAKAMWLDAADPVFSFEGPVSRSDGSITTVAEVLQPLAEDLVGAAVTDRSPALVCLSLTDAQEAEYESASASDQMLEEYYRTWSRSVLRIVHFLGPATGRVYLRPKSTGAAAGFVGSDAEVVAAPGTMLVFREAAVEYSLEEPGEGQMCWLTAFLLKPGPQLDLGALEGDLAVFEVPLTGPPPPRDTVVSVCAISIQACGNMGDHHKEWAAYIAGCDAQLEMPYSRFDYTPYYSEEVDAPMGTTYVKHFSVQEGVELFDNKTFEISNMEAEAMDPLCRQVLEVGYLSCFQIGVTKKWSNTHPTHASVSVGMDKQEWVTMPNVPRSVATNNQLAIVANRFNYVFNLKGGSYVMDTACSSSLCATHLGKVNLLEQRWDPLEWHLGLGTGVTLTVGSFIHSCAAHMLSNGGRCFTFNATANGYNRGDGTAAMLLKVGTQDEQRVCYFRGSQIGQDGRSASMSAPNGPAQEKCIWGALREAKMDPPDSTVWECHGTGTSLGDPIEVGAVRRVQIKMKRHEPLMVASSKSNCGHLEGSAAALAMNKCVLVVINIMCAPTQHLRVLNPHLDHTSFDAIFVNETNPYKFNAGHCQVSSFGVGGTNGHAIFWGEGYRPPVDHRGKLMQKLMQTSATIIVDGKDPANWEYQGVPYDLRPGERCKMVYSKDPLTGQEEIRFDRHMDEPEPVQFYCTTGNFNEWGDDRMAEGDVPGLYHHEVEIPLTGTLEFRILADGDQDRAIGPEETTTSMTARVLGPSADMRNSWIVHGAPASPWRIELLAPMHGVGGKPGSRTISWRPVKD